MHGTFGPSCPQAREAEPVCSLASWVTFKWSSARFPSKLSLGPAFLSAICRQSVMGSGWAWASPAQEAG